MDAYSLYPDIEPFNSGYLLVGDGHSLYYEVCGNPDGRPVVYLHGGPGAGCNPNLRRFFDPAAYKIILFDQRGAGRSSPVASIEHNTTQDLVKDIESLRLHLGIERWLVFGGSWGSTLALAYAAAYRDSCGGLILRGVWLCRPSDLIWWFYERRRVFPDYWREFASQIPVSEQNDLLGAYARRLNNPDPAIHMPAAIAWRKYEIRCDTLLPRHQLEIPVTKQTLALARIEAHYMTHSAFLISGQLLSAVESFRDIPAVIIHGRYDMSCSLDAAFLLVERWPNAVLNIVADAGHSAMEPGIAHSLIAATNQFRNVHL